MQIIRAEALQYLPLRAQPLDQWDENTDCHNFLCELFDQDATVEDTLGNVQKTNFRVYGTYLYSIGVESATRSVDSFASKALTVVPAHASIVRQVEVPDFQKNPAYGQASKYLIAWDGVLSQVLSESAFFSIAHALESQADLETSRLLASEMYYKHAILILRSFLENIVLPIGFTDNREGYIAWREGRFNTPPLRGKSGLLTRLVIRGLISETLADEVAGLYGDFNAYVHGSEHRLIHGGHHLGAYRGHLFLLDQFETWVDYLSRSVDVAIRLMAVHTAHWQGVRPRTEQFCSVCHEDSDFTTETKAFGTKYIIQDTCNKCGNVMNRAEPRDDLSFPPATP